ncbi:MAG TPA: sigma-70 family RNA polymerase sigma factor [Streptosporangiales bacterium]
MTEELLVRARSGDEDAFRELTEPHRRELHVHCYRIVGSVQDAEDLVQETLLAAWRGLATFEERSPVRAWLYRIATNRCLNAMRDSTRRPQPNPPVALPAPTRRADPVWLQPYPDVLLDDIPDHAPGPESRYEAREATELAFIAALQHLPPRQRAVLVLRDVLGYRTAEVAAMLDVSEVSVKSGLQRARATLRTHLPDDASRAPAPNSARERELAGRFAEAMARADIAGLVDLLTADAWLRMPPEPHEYQGHAAIAAFLDGGAMGRGTPLHVVPTRANTQPAFGCYLPTPPARIARAYGLLVLTLDGDGISALTWFADTSVFPHFGLPRTFPT